MRERRTASAVSLWGLFIFLIASKASVASESPGNDAVDLPFGFSGLEIYRASFSSSTVRTGDMDGDGRLDVVYAYNSDTSIRVLLQRSDGQTPGGGAEVPLPDVGSINEVAFDQRFAPIKIYTEKEIKGLDIGDLNGDGKPDIAYYGDPPELVVLYQNGEWGSKQEKFPISDGISSPRALSVVDVNADRRPDLVLLGRGKSYLLYQNEDGTLASPEVLYNSSAEASSLDVVDVDGNGEVDLVTYLPAGESPVVVRFQQRGVFGSETRISMQPLRDALFADLGDGKPPALVTIQGNTRRVMAYRWGKAKRDVGSRSYVSTPGFFAFRPEHDSKSRRLDFGDINGDGQTDVVVTYGDFAEVDVMLQRVATDGAGLTRSIPSPTLSDVRGLAIGDFCGSDKTSVVVVSGREKTIGVSHWEPAGRLSVPRTFPVEGEPLLLKRCPLPDGGGSPQGNGLFLITRSTKEESKERRRVPYWLFLVTFDPGGKPRVASEFPLTLRAQPNGLLVTDVNGDGLKDCIVFVPYDNPKIVLTSPPADGESGLAFDRDLGDTSDFGIGQLANVTSTAVSTARFPIRPEERVAPEARDLVVSSKSHARALRVGKDSRLEIVEQFSGQRAGANVVGSIGVNLDDDADLEVIMFDAAASAIDILDRGERGLYELGRTIRIPRLKFAGFTVEDLNGDGRTDIVVLGAALLAVFYAGVESDGFTELAQFDPSEHDDDATRRYGRPESLAFGDLNADGQPEVIFSSSPKYYLTALRSARGAKEPRGDVLRGEQEASFRFQIFEEKSYMRQGGKFGPRELVVTDITGDKKDDLLLLIHDRLLLYVQE